VEIQTNHQLAGSLTRRDVLRAAAAGLVLGTGLWMIPKRYFRLAQEAQTFVAKVDPLSVRRCQCHFERDERAWHQGGRSEGQADSAQAEPG
jgi:hypothetical protein